MPEDRPFRWFARACFTLPFLIGLVLVLAPGILGVPLYFRVFFALLGCLPFAVYLVIARLVMLGRPRATTIKAMLYSPLGTAILALPMIFLLALFNMFPNATTAVFITELMRVLAAIVVTGYVCVAIWLVAYKVAQGAGWLPPEPAYPRDELGA